MKLPPSVLEEVKSRFDIVQYVSRYVELRRSGSNFKGLCPFHHEKTPSFMVTPSKGIYKCFGCGEGGDIISFLRGMENISFTESVTLLAKEGGVDLSEYDTAEAQFERTESDLLYKLNDEARSFYAEYLKSDNGKIAQQYLHNRTISDRAQQTFSIGFAPANGEELVSHLHKKGFKDEDIVKGGLAILKDNGSLLDKFRNRIIVPFLNLSSLTCGFTGRVINENDNPKYLNSPETVVFKKGNFLFGLVQAREAVKKEGHLILVEGNFDLITIFDGGITNAAATSGTALTERQALLIKRFTDRVTIVYDGDKAGQAATARGLPLLMNAGLIVRIAVLPSGDDPDSYLRKNGKEAFNALVAEAQDIVDFSINRFGFDKDLSIPENKTALIKEMGELLRTVSDPVLRSQFVKKTAEKTGVNENLILGKAPAKFRQEQSVSVQKSRADLVPPLEKYILESLINDCENSLLPISRFIHSSDFTNEHAKKLLSVILEEGEFHSSMLQSLSPEVSDLATLLAVSVVPEGETNRINGLNDVMLKIKEKSIKRARAELKLLPNNSEEDRAKITKEFDSLTKEINSLREISELEKK